MSTIISGPYIRRDIPLLVRVFDPARAVADRISKERWVSNLIVYEFPDTIRRYEQYELSRMCLPPKSMHTCFLRLTHYHVAAMGKTAMSPEIVNG